MAWISVGLWLLSTLVFVLGPIILIHELGHYFAAKLGGIRVEEFGFGFPPRAIKLWRGRGHFEIGETRVIIPLGFRLPPELTRDPWEEADQEKQEHWVEAVAEKKRDTFVLRSLTLLDPDCDELSSKRNLDQERLQLRGKLDTWEPGTLYSLNWLPMGAFVRMTGEEGNFADPRSLASRPKRWRITAMGAGAALNLVAAFVLMVCAFLSGIPEDWTVRINAVYPDSAAEAAGLQPDDVFLSIEGTKIDQGSLTVQSTISGSVNQPIEMVVLRNDQPVALTGVPGPRECGSEEPYCAPGSGFLGFEMSQIPDAGSLRRYSLPEAIGASVDEFANIFELLIALPGRLVRGEASPAEARLTSPVGTTQILTFFLQQSVEWKLAAPVLQGASLISLALGVTNLLPLPALDGGRIFFILVETVTGRRIAPEREAVVHFIGLVVLVTVMAFVMLQDIFDPIISWYELK